jgi:hypothetical protein
MRIRFTNVILDDLISSLLGEAPVSNDLAINELFEALGGHHRVRVGAWRKITSGKQSGARKAISSAICETRYDSDARGPWEVHQYGEPTQNARLTSRGQQ